VIIDTLGAAFYVFRRRVSFLHRVMAAVGALVYAQLVVGALPKFFANFAAPGAFFDLVAGRRK
jgi:hypothetical protein